MFGLSKNTIVVLGVVLMVFAGYYFFLQDSAGVIRTSESSAQLEQMLAKTQVFIQHRGTLDEISLDTSLFSDPKFMTLTDHTPPPNEFNVSRENPFVPAEKEQPITTEDSVSFTGETDPAE